MRGWNQNAWVESLIGGSGGFGSFGGGVFVGRLLFFGLFGNGFDDLDGLDLVLLALVATNHKRVLQSLPARQHHHRLRPDVLVFNLVFNRMFPNVRYFYCKDILHVKYRA